MGSSVEDRNSRQLNQTRIATHDGYIWPRPRQQMTDAAEIRRRMAQEARADMDRAGADAVITRDDFLRRGWTALQVDAHLPAAIDLAGSGRRKDAA